VSAVLSADNKRQLWVPPGFAHGFYVLSDWAELNYKTTDFYAPEWERSILWSDPEIGIKWPILPGTEPLLSTKDTQARLLAHTDLFD
jgi:dTDP-4-dehydrorhamnose 3,5-epimerase